MSRLTNVNKLAPSDMMIDVGIYRIPNKETIKMKENIYPKVRIDRTIDVPNRGNNIIESHDVTPKLDTVQEKNMSKFRFKINNLTRSSGSNRYNGRESISHNSVIGTNTIDPVARNLKKNITNKYPVDLKNDIIVEAFVDFNRIVDTRNKITVNSKISGKMNRKVKSKRKKCFQYIKMKYHDLSSIYEEEHDMNIIPTRFSNKSLGTEKLQYANNVRTVEHKNRKKMVTIIKNYR